MLYVLHIFRSMYILVLFTNRPGAGTVHTIIWLDHSEFYETDYMKDLIKMFLLIYFFQGWGRKHWLFYKNLGLWYEKWSQVDRTFGLKNLSSEVRLYCTAWVAKVQTFYFLFYTLVEVVIFRSVIYLYKVFVFLTFYNFIN